MAMYKKNDNRIGMVKVIQREERCRMHTHLFMDHRNYILYVNPQKRTINVKTKFQLKKKKILNRIEMRKRKRHNTKNKNNRENFKECITETEKRLIDQRNQERNRIKKEQ